MSEHRFPNYSGTHRHDAHRRHLGTGYRISSLHFTKPAREQA
jgi:hypothetical protein